MSTEDHRSYAYELAHDLANAYEIFNDSKIWSMIQLTNAKIERPTYFSWLKQFNEYCKLEKMGDEYELILRGENLLLVEILAMVGEVQ